MVCRVLPSVAYKYAYMQRSKTNQRTEKQGEEKEFLLMTPQHTLRGSCLVGVNSHLFRSYCRPTFTDTDKQTHNTGANAYCHTPPAMPLMTRHKLKCALAHCPVPCSKHHFYCAVTLHIKEVGYVILHGFHRQFKSVC